MPSRVAPHPTRAVLAAALAFLSVALLAPAASHASVVTTPGAFPVLTFTANPGEDNRGSIDCDFNFGGSVSTCVVTDFEGITEDSTICEKTDTFEVTCESADLDNFPVVELGDLDDFIDINADSFSGYEVTAGPGDDTVLGSDGGGGDTIHGNGGADWLEGDNNSDEIHGGDGRDTIIGGGGFNQIFGEDGNDVLMSGPWLGTNSAITGGNGDDILIGGWAFDTLSGGPGNDLLDGGRLNDQMDGGPDHDIVDYTDRDDPITVVVNDQADDGGLIDEGAGGARDRVGLSVEAVLGGQGDDQLTAAPALAITFAGNGGNDTLVGSNQIDVLRGGPGGDTIDGRFGADTVDGEGAADTALYTTRSAPVAVSLDDARNDGEDPNQDGISTGPEEGDVLRSIERASTGTGNDILVGSAGVNVLLGGGGNDTLDGLLGADTLDGQSGVDTVDYSDRVDRVAVRLDNTRNDGADPNGDRTSGPGEERDLILAVENARGGGGDDFLWGNGLLNLLTGGPGADAIRSRDGTALEDVVNCGAGAGDVVDADAADDVANCEANATLP